MRLTAAQLLWPSDEKKASALVTQAIEIIRQLIADNAAREEGDYQQYQSVMNLREQVINALAPHDPEAALKFLQSTHQVSDVASPDEQELQLESSLIGLIVAKDPQRAFELAEDLLKRSASPALIQTLTQLATKNRDLACRLARDIAKKIEDQDFLKSNQSAYLSTNLLQVVRNSPAPAKQGAEKGRLLTDEEYRDLFLKVVAEVMAYQKSDQESYGPEYALIRILAATIGQMDQEVKTYAGDRAAAINQKISELGVTPNPMGDWQRYQTTVNTEPVDSALQFVAQAPAPMRDYLYQQLVNRIATAGDVSRARQIATEKVENASQRQQLLATLQERDITFAAEKGKFDEAFRLLSKLPQAGRYALLNQIVERIGPNVKRQQAIQYLEQAKNLTSTSLRAEDSDQMQTLLTIARALARHDINRSFQITEPLIGQLNEISAAAVTLNGFGQQYYVEGELITTRDNSVADAASQVADTLATLAMFDFDRAKRNADGINRLDARVRTFLKIAERTLELRIDTEESQARVNY